MILYLPSESRNNWYQDAGGMWTTIKDMDDTRSYTISWADVLAGDSITASAWLAVNGDVFFSNEAFDYRSTSVTVQKQGIAKNTVSTLAGLIYVKRFNFRAPDDSSIVHDYVPYLPYG